MSVKSLLIILNLLIVDLKRIPRQKAPVALFFHNRNLQLFSCEQHIMLSYRNMRQTQTPYKIGQI
jgi:hypothetical protein